MWPCLSEMFCSGLCSVLVIACKSLGVEEPCNEIEIRGWECALLGIDSTIKLAQGWGRLSYPCYS